jgi:formylglycine-generating enzyme required for sulfatase activity
MKRFLTLAAFFAIFCATSASAQQDYIETAAGLDIKMIYVDGGTFKMGSTDQDPDAGVPEKPQHDVTVDSFYIAEFVVTQAQWKKLMGTTITEQRDKYNSAARINGEGDNTPIYYVSWEEAVAFCEKLSEISGKKYVLPTEAQWEFAARGGNKSRGTQFSGSNTVTDVAWIAGYSNNINQPVGQLQPNELGIYDMSGNVMEWCSDWFDRAYYSVSPAKNPVGPDSGTNKVARGGSRNYYARHCRVAARISRNPADRFPDIGFRIVSLP